MKVELVLYSRSLTKDYRWICLPSQIPQASIESLKKIYNFLDNKKSDINEKESILIGISDNTYYYLLAYKNTSKKDIASRDIYGLQGVAVNRIANPKSAVDFCSLCPYFVEILPNCLPYFGIEFSDLDNLSYSVRETDLSVFEVINSKSSKIRSSYKKILKSPSDFYKIFNPSEQNYFLKFFSTENDLKYFPFSSPERNKIFFIDIQEAILDIDTTNNSKNNNVHFSIDKEGEQENAKQLQPTFDSIEKIKNSTIVNSSNYLKKYTSVCHVSIINKASIKKENPFKTFFSFLYKNEDSKNHEYGIYLWYENSDDLIYFQDAPEGIDDSFFKQNRMVFNPNDEQEMRLSVYLSILDSKLKEQGWFKIQSSDHPWWSPIYGK